MSPLPSTLTWVLNLCHQLEARFSPAERLTGHKTILDTTTKKTFSHGSFGGVMYHDFIVNTAWNCIGWCSVISFTGQASCITWSEKAVLLWLTSGTVGVVPWDLECPKGSLAICPSGNSPVVVFLLPGFVKGWAVASVRQSVILISSLEGCWSQPLQRRRGGIGNFPMTM